MVHKYLVEKIKNPLVNFLSQGVTPEKLALSMVFGVAIGIFPFFGTHTALVMLAVLLFRLNPGAIFLVSNLVFPLFLIGFIPMINTGKLLFGNVTHTEISVEKIKSIYESGLLPMVQYLGMNMVYALAGWCIIIIPVSFIIYVIFVPVFRRMSIKFAGYNISKGD